MTVEKLIRVLREEYRPGDVVFVKSGTSEPAPLQELSTDVDEDETRITLIGFGSTFEKEGQ